LLPKNPAGRKTRGWRPQLSVEMAGVFSFEERPMTVFVYVNTSKQVGDAEHVKVFANADAAEAWFAENDPEGVAFEYEVIGPP